MEVRIPDHLLRPYDDMNEYGWFRRVGINHQGRAHKIKFTLSIYSLDGPYLIVIVSLSVVIAMHVARAALTSSDARRPSFCNDVILILGLSLSRCSMPKMPISNRVQSQ